MSSTLITAFVGLVATLVAGAVAARQTFRLDIERKLKDRELNAEDVLTKYREPLAAAAMDLQSRCYNIVRLGFFERFDRKHERYEAAQKTTLFRFAQYFGWTEILRRDIQYLSFPENEDTKCVAQLQGEIARRIASSDHDEVLMIWTDEQRAIGERMIVHDGDKSFCMGYARFCDDYDDCFAQLFERVLPHLDDPAAHVRLGETQVLLCRLVSALDKDGLRYTQEHLKLAIESA